MDNNIINAIWNTSMMIAVSPILPPLPVMRLSGILVTIQIITKTAVPAIPI